jgi:tRNA-dihydrouridine synthase
MLAPMQGVTNWALRSLFIEWVRPDLVFTEFMRVGSGDVRRLAATDRRQLAAEEGGVPLVVQLIGHGRDALVDAAKTAEAAGVRHINLNMGCPYGRMTSSLTGGGMLKRPDQLEEIIPPLREAIRGSFSIKLRSGFDDPEQVLSLLPLFERAGVDFLVLHPRTVRQEYEGVADHGITARVVRQTSIPVIANGDIRTADDGMRVWQESGAAGLMLGRGAIADPLLFHRLRGMATAEPTIDERRAITKRYLQELLPRYARLFCGEAQLLSKMKGVVKMITHEELRPEIKALCKCQNLCSFTTLLDDLS